MQKILITGGNGFIAFNFIKIILENDYDIVSIDNLSLSKYLNHETINIESDKFKFIECDITSNDEFNTYYANIFTIDTKSVCSSSSDYFFYCTFILNN